MTNTYYAYVSYTYNGGDRIFTIPFSYIRKEDIKVFINGEETTNFTFNTTSQISITDTLTVGNKIEIKRDSDVENRMVVFTNTSIMNKDNQNLAHQQTFNVVQEVHDDLALYTKDVEDIFPMLEKAYEHIDAIEGVYENRDAVTTVADDLNDDDSNIKTVASNISNVNKVGTIDGDVTKVADIDSYIPRVAVMDDEISTIAQTSNIEKIAIVGADLGSQSSKIITVANDIKTGGTNYTNTVAANISNVNAVGGNISNVNAVANNATNINAVNSNKTNIDAVAGNATNINAVNSNKTNINTVANSSSNINTVAGNISNVNSCASNITAINNAVTSAASASASATTATAQANKAEQQANLAKRYAEETHGASDVTIANLRASSAYLNYEYPQTDAEGLADVTSYAHSTFDLSKFTVVGSPTITNDGIASGFGLYNYLYSSVSLTNQFELKGSFKTSPDDVNTGKGVFALTNNYNASPTYYLAFNVHQLTGGVALFGKNNGTDYSIDYVTTVNYQDGQEHFYTVSYDGTTIKLVIDGNTVINKTYDLSAVISHIQYVTIGAIHGARYFRGSIDLKQFSITVDGVPVFSGNQTGIDAIKPDDYTVVGTPTISADGIASGFSASNYLTTTENINLTTSQSVKMKFHFKTLSDVSTRQMILMSNTYNQFSLELWGGNLRLSCGKNNIWVSDNPLIINSSVQANTDYYLVFDFTSSGVQYAWSTDNSNWTTGTNATYTFLPDVYDMELRVGLTRNASLPFSGSIDLNSFKIYVNGDLVYQPCLKIPYTLSKTGSKIVDSAYRDRVNDMYEQFGYANYFTLSDVDFTVPQGNLYGMINPDGFDREWQAVSTEESDPTDGLINSSSANGIYTVDLSNILPKDNYKYECIFSTQGSVSSGEGLITIYSYFGDSKTSDYVFLHYEHLTTKNSFSQYTGIVGTARQLRIRIGADSSVSQNTKLQYYRRLGTNR